METDLRTTESRVREVLEREGYPSEEPVTARLTDDLGLDSLDKMEFVVAIEEEFNLPDTDPVCEDKWQTVLDVVHYVDGLK